MLIPACVARRITKFLLCASLGSLPPEVPPDGMGDVGILFSGCVSVCRFVPVDFAERGISVHT